MEISVSRLESGDVKVDMTYPSLFTVTLKTRHGYYTKENINRFLSHDDVVRLGRFFHHHHIGFSASLSTSLFSPTSAEQSPHVKVVRLDEEYLGFYKENYQHIKILLKCSATPERVYGAFQNPVVVAYWKTLDSSLHLFLSTLFRKIQEEEALRRPIPLRRTEAQGSLSFQRTLEHLEAHKRPGTPPPVVVGASIPKRPRTQPPVVPPPVVVVVPAPRSSPLGSEDVPFATRV